MFARMELIVLLCTHVAQGRSMDGVVVLIHLPLVVVMECIAVLLDTFALLLQWGRSVLEVKKKINNKIV